MKGWENCRIGNVVEVQQGLCINSKSNHLLEKTGIPLLRITDLINNAEVQYINEHKVNKKFISKKTDLIFTRTGQVGLVFKNRIGIIHNNCFSIIPSVKIFYIYLYFYLKQNSIYEYVNGVAGGAAQPDLGHVPFKSTPFHYPPLPIQRKIAAIFSAYDDLIENNNRRIAILEKMAEELYREWFVRLRFPGHEKVKIVKGVPEGWVVKRIGEICFEERSLLKKKNIQDSAKYVGLEHITPSSFVIKDHGFATDIQSDKLVFSFGDILFGKIRPYLHKVSIAHFKGICSSDTIVIKQRLAAYQGFTYLTVSSQSFIDMATTASTGTKMPRADWNFLIQQKILCPHITLLESFQKIFDQLFQSICNYQMRSDQLKESRDRLLSRLMSGKIDVENLDIQFPASMKEA